MSEILTNQAGEPLIATVPVISGRGYRSARIRLHGVMSALQLGEVSASIAVGEFSTLYRNLPLYTEIQVSFTWDSIWLTLSLDVNVPAALAPQITEQLVHFHGETRESDPDTIHVQLSRTYPLEAGANPSAAYQLLSKPTAEELERDAVLTQMALNQTQFRLSSVQEDLRIAADIQQRMLVPASRMQQIHPAVDCHAFMVPCRDIGGDFYDVINLDIDHLAVVVGDVSGKGVTAALMMASCMTLLRAYSESFRSPSRIMRKINPRLIEGNEEECLFTTLFLAIINVKNNSLIYCNAGHNPALIQRSDGSVEELAEIHGPAVGVMNQVDYEQSRVNFNSGDRLLLYTDGASETFNPSGELFGSERILKHYRNVSTLLSSSEMLASLLNELNQFSGSELPHDDVTMVAIQRSRNSNLKIINCEVQEPATPEGLTALLAASDAFCAQEGLSTSISGRLQLVLDELFVNVMNHGADGQGLAPTLCLLLRILPELNRLVVEIRDDGMPFNPFVLAEPDTSLSIEERELGGLGIFLVRSLAQSFSYNYDSPWNCILLEIDCLASEE
jgi:phosphoserine phosphatase RsbU/P